MGLSITPTGPAILAAYAAEVGATLTEMWGRLALIHERPFDLDRLREIVESDDFVAIGRFGADLDIELHLSPEAPSDLDLQALQSVVATENERRTLLNPADCWAVAESAQSILTEVEVRYRRANWCPSLETFNRLVRTDWMKITDSLVDADITVGTVSVSVRRVNGTTSDLILEPTYDRPSTDEPDRQIWDAITALADVTAWRQIAVDETRYADGMCVALHRDQPPIIPLNPTHASGGLNIWKWLNASDDPNRHEALRHILRLLTATAAQIPNGASTLALAERYRIALSHDKAAEVHRAISEGRTLTNTGLRDARRALSSYTEDAVKTAQGSVVAAVGIVALVARNATALPKWLLGMVTAVAVVGVVTLILNRWRRIGDLGSDVESLEAALSEDKAPLLPEMERAELLKGLKQFDVTREIRTGRVSVVRLGLIAIAVILAAGTWIIAQNDDPALGVANVIAVAGYLRVEGGLSELCETLSSDSPPNCTGRNLTIRGVDTANLSSLTAMDGIEWTLRPLTAVGTIVDETLVATSVSEG